MDNLHVDHRQPLRKDTEAGASFDQSGEGVPVTNGSWKVGVSKVLSAGLWDKIVKVSGGDQVTLVNCDSLGPYLIEHY